MKVEFAQDSLPILRECDVAVVGGSFAAISAALEFARAGRRVLLLEPRTYLGREATATLRPWLLNGLYPFDSWLADLVATAGGARDPGHSPLVTNEIPLHPDKLKLFLEDLLLSAGVDLLYSSLPVAVLVEDGIVCGLIIGNKSGRQVVVCSQILDASETALVLRLAGVPLAPDVTLPQRCWRTLEFHGVEATPETSLSVPSSLGVVGDSVNLHPGYLGGSHVYVEFAMDLPVEGSGHRALMRREIEARHRGMKLASHLLQHSLPFSWATLAGSSYELHALLAPQMECPQPAQWLNSDAELQVPRIQGHPVTLRLSSFASPVAGLWCLQEAAKVPDDLRQLFLDPVPSQLLGRAVADAILQHWAELPKTAFQAPQVLHFHVPESQPPAPLTVRCHPAPDPCRPYERLRVGRTALPCLDRTQVLVVGGGSSGALAAIVSSKHGASTILVDMNPGLGGTGTFGGVDSYWMGHRNGFVSTIVEPALKEVQRALNYRYEPISPDPNFYIWNLEAKAYALLKEAVAAGVEPLFNTICFGTIVRDNYVAGAAFATRYGPVAIIADVVVDATGDGDVAAFAGAQYVYGAERDNTVMWYSLPQFIRPGRTTNNFTSMVDVSNIRDYTRAVLVGRRRNSPIHDHGVYVATRESRHILGDVVLTLTDQLRQRKWPDVVNIHFSNYDVKGKTSSDWVLLGLIPPNLEIEVPYRALLPSGLEGILVAGKAISARADALPSIRMQPDLENLGGVAGLAAAMAASRSLPPRSLPVVDLQRQLVQKGVLPPHILTRKLTVVRYTEADIEQLVNCIADRWPLYQYNNMRMTDVFADIIPIVEICCQGQRAIPVLERALSGAQGTKRLAIAQALAFLGSQKGVPVILEHIDRELAQGVLPPRKTFILNSNLTPPDQGAMPDLAYLLYTLGMARDARSISVWNRVADLLQFTEEDLRSFFKCPFFYIDAICYGAELLGDPRAVPVLKKLHSNPLVRGQWCHNRWEIDFLKERQAMLELAIARALARLGSTDGYEVLVAYLDDTRALLAEQAYRELLNITGVSLPKEQLLWKQWLLANRQSLPVKPRVRRLEDEIGHEGEAILR
jgi:ribulose 1,5-bisphosphate synthetase/thiazole synthase